MATTKAPKQTKDRAHHSSRHVGTAGAERRKNDASPERKSGFIAGPIRDSVFLIAAPLVAILAYLPFYYSETAKFPLPSGITSKEAPTLTHVFLSAFIFAHLFIVFFRSHVNTSIFRMHPYRFTLVPAVLFLACWASTWVLVATMIIGVWWDVYHSAMQTFGIARIYDMKAGNNPLAGRRLDQVLNVLLYIGPILGGVSLMLHVTANEGQLNEYAGVQMSLFERIPFEQKLLAQIVLSIGALFLLYYLFAYYRLARNGYRISYQKVFLLIITAVVSIGCWGFNSFGEAFFVMNFFHALQYFFIVWYMEGRRITDFFRVERFRFGPQMALALFLAAGFGFGVLAVVNLDASGEVFKRGVVSLLIMVSIMHFWYDGFIWSVRKKQV